MAYPAKSDFLWYTGCKAIDEVKDADHIKGWLNAGLIVKVGNAPVVKESLDLNNDGKVDKKDAKKASRVLNSFRRGRRTK